MSGSSLNLCRATRRAAAKKTLNNRGDSTHLFYVKLLRVIPVAIPDTSSHPFEELADNCNHPPWNSIAGEYLPEKGAVDRVVCLLNVDKAQTKRHASLPLKFLQPSLREHHVQG